MRTTKKHFDYFEDRVWFWANILGLRQYEILIAHSDLGSGKLGQTELGNHWAQVCLNKSWNRKPTDAELDRVACHECIHILLNRIMRMAEERFITEDVIMDELENLTRTFEGVIYACYSGVLRED